MRRASVLVSEREIMDRQIVVRRAEPAQFERVGHLTHKLLGELYPEIGYERDQCIETARKLLAGSEAVWSFLAIAPDEGDVGVVLLNECASIYAGGRFGEISELYVAPGFRSQGVGALLIEAAIARTVDFYLRHGFEEVGPRLDLKL
jgi:GNAT superfamily N-acetyltransferase